MDTRQALRRALLGGAVSLIATAAVAQGDIRNFDVPDIHKETFPLAINTAGAITGFSFDHRDLHQHGFLRAPSGTITLFDAALDTVPAGIADDGTIVGRTSDGSMYHGFLRMPDGTVTLFDAPGATDGTLPLAISTNGLVTGEFGDAGGAVHGFLRTRGGAIKAFDAPGAGTAQAQGTYPQAINFRGDVAGYVADASGKAHAFLRKHDGSFTVFDAPCGADTLGTDAAGINGAGTIAGNCYSTVTNSHGYVRAADGTITVFNFNDAPSTTVYGISKSGYVTGMFMDRFDGLHGYKRSPKGGVRPLDAFGAGEEAFQGTEANAINSHGTITGEYFDSRNRAHGFVTP